jgi:hypothetical protein
MTSGCWSLQCQASHIIFYRRRHPKKGISHSKMHPIPSHHNAHYRFLLLISCLHILLAQNAPAVRVPTSPQNVPTIRIPSAPVTSVNSPAPSPLGGVALLPDPTAKPASSTVVPVPTPRNATSRPATVLPTATYPPTITALPTVSAFPTGSPAPTSEQCNICGTGVISFNDLLVLPTGNVTCAEAADFGRRGMVPSSNCVVLQDLVAANNVCACIRENNDTTPTAAPTSLPTFDPCFICGDGNIVSILDGKLPLPNATAEPLHCSFVESGGELGFLEPAACAYFSGLAQNTSDPCGCVPDPTTPSPAGTEAPTSAYPPCYVCGNATEQVTARETVVVMPDAVIKTLEESIDPSVLTCAFVEERGRYNNSFDRLVCSYLQMTVPDVCACQPGVAPTAVPAHISVPAPPVPAPVSSARTVTSFVALVLLPLSSWCLAWWQ